MARRYKNYLFTSGGKLLPGQTAPEDWIQIPGAKRREETNQNPAVTRAIACRFYCPLSFLGFSQVSEWCIHGIGASGARKGQEKKRMAQVGNDSQRTPASVPINGKFSVSRGIDKNGCGRITVAMTGGQSDGSGIGIRGLACSINPPGFLARSSASP